MARLRPALVVATAIAAAGCASAGLFLQELFKERPPLALESLEPTSPATARVTMQIHGITGPGEAGE